MANRLNKFKINIGADKVIGATDLSKRLPVVMEEADRSDKLIVLKNGTPALILIDFDKYSQMTNDIDIVCNEFDKLKRENDLLKERNNLLKEKIAILEEVLEYNDIYKAIKGRANNSKVNYNEGGRDRLLSIINKNK